MWQMLMIHNGFQSPVKDRATGQILTPWHLNKTGTNQEHSSKVQNPKQNQTLF